MHPQGVDVLNKAYSDHVVVRIPYDLQFQLLPAQDRFLHQDLPYQAGLQPPGTDYLQFLPVIDQPAPCAAHGIGRPQHHRVAKLFGNGKGFRDRIGNLASSHLNAQAVHGLFKFDTVFPPLNGIHLHTDHLHLVLVQNPCLVQFRAQIKP